MMKPVTNHYGYLRLFPFTLAFFVLVGILELLVFGILGIDLEAGPEVLPANHRLLVLLVELVGTLLVVWLFVRFVERLPFSEVGFQRKNGWQESGAGFLAGALAIVSGVLILFVTGKLKFEPLQPDLRAIANSVLFYFAVAVTEELLFRGYVLRSLMQSFNKPVAVIISSLGFAAMHLFNPHMGLQAFIDLFLSGLVFGFAYSYTKRLWFPIGLHWSWNLVQSWADFNVSGTPHQALVKTQLSGPEWITGGAFGFEASIYAILIDSLLVIGIIAYYSSRRGLIKR